MNRILLVLILMFSLSSSAYEPSTDMPKQSDVELEQLKGLGVNEKLGGEISLDRRFTNEEGQVVPLSAYFDGTRPVLLTMAYYSCPSLCNYQLNSFLETFKDMGTPLGKDFQFLVVSMNHRETPDLAGAKKENYLEELGQPGAENSWHHLVGTEENVAALADELGFSFRWLPEQQEYAHAAVAFVITPEGMISRYLHGIDFSAKTLRLSMVEAASGKIGNLIDQIILFCFQFNPAKNKYTLYAYNIMRGAAGLTVFLLGIFLIPIWLREKRGATC